MSYPNSTIAHSTKSATIVSREIPTPGGLSAALQANPAQLPADWQARAISSYRQVQRQALAVLPELLATRVSALTGRAVKPADVFVDLDAELATIVVDRVVFRARNQQVVVLRSCVECGSEHFESRPLFSRTDLGYALSAWQPLCYNCQPEDPANWLQS